MNRRFVIVLCFLFPWVVGCQPTRPEERIFGKGKSLGTNKNELLEEASGLAASVANPGCLWSHNDSGHPPEIFLLDSAAKTRKVFRLAKIKNRDWEDLTLGPCGNSDSFCLYVGDIGDNMAQYPYKYIYRFKEPSIDDAELIETFDTLVVKLPDDLRDTETLMADPISHHLYLVSKREKSVILYELPNPAGSDTLMAEKVCRLNIRDIVSGSISSDGREVLLKNYEHIYYWKKKDRETIVELMQTPPLELPYHPEPQGEAIAWARDGSGYFTLGENAKGQRAKLYFYKRK